MFRQSAWDLLLGLSNIQISEEKEEIGGEGVKRRS